MVQIVKNIWKDRGCLKIDATYLYDNDLLLSLVQWQ